MYFYFLTKVLFYASRALATHGCSLTSKASVWKMPLFIVVTAPKEGAVLYHFADRKKMTLPPGSLQAFSFIHLIHEFTSNAFGQQSITKSWSIAFDEAELLTKWPWSFIPFTFMFPPTQSESEYQKWKYPSKKSTKISLKLLWSLSQVAVKVPQLRNWLNLAPLLIQENLLSNHVLPFQAFPPVSPLCSASPHHTITISLDNQYCNTLVSFSTHFQVPCTPLSPCIEPLPTWSMSDDNQKIKFWPSVATA